VASVRITGNTETVEVQGSKVVKVREYHCVAVVDVPGGATSEVYFQFRRPKAIPASTVHSVAQQFADRIEGVLNLANVTDVVYSQDTSQGGRLQDRMTTYYASADGSIEGDVESDLAHFGPGYTGSQVAAELGVAGGYLA
jgi:hypothetical protein